MSDDDLLGIKRSEMISKTLKTRFWTQNTVFSSIFVLPETSNGSTELSDSKEGPQLGHSSNLEHSNERQRSSEHKTVRNSTQIIENTKFEQIVFFSVIFTLREASNRSTELVPSREGPQVGHSSNLEHSNERHISSGHLGTTRRVRFSACRLLSRSVALGNLLSALKSYPRASATLGCLGVEIKMD